jgi:hypothetical protein
MGKVILLFVFTVISLFEGNIYSQSFKIINCDLQSGDTTFLVNERIIYVHENDTLFERRAIYIDPNKLSQHYSTVCDFDFSLEHSDNLEYYNLATNLQQKKIPKDLPTTWIPLYFYNEKYYLYKPCQLVIPRYQITDSVLNYTGWMDGTYGFGYENIIKKSKDHYYIRGIEGFNNTEINIYIIDKKNEIAVFEFDDKDYPPHLYVSAKEAHKFPIIVYESDNLHSEYDFPEPAFDKLLEKFK